MVRHDVEIAIERNDILQLNIFYPISFDPVDDSMNLILVFFWEFRPKKAHCCFTEEPPVTLVTTMTDQFQRFNRVSDFTSKKLAILKTSLISIPAGSNE